MTKEELENWLKNYRKLRNYILCDASKSQDKKSKKKIIVIKKNKQKSVNNNKKMHHNKKNNSDKKNTNNHNNKTKVKDKSHNTMVNCKKLEENQCKPPDCIWVNKKRKYCRTKKNKK